MHEARVETQLLVAMQPEIAREAKSQFDTKKMTFEISSQRHRFTETRANLPKADRSNATRIMPSQVRGLVKGVNELVSRMPDQVEIENLKQRGAIAAALIPRLGRDKVSEYLDDTYQNLLCVVSNNKNGALYANFQQQVCTLMEHLHALVAETPRSDAARRIANFLSVEDIYVYFSTAHQHAHRFSEALYVLNRMNAADVTIKDVLDRAYLKIVDLDVLPPRRIKQYCKVSDLFAQATPQDFTLMSLRDRGMIIAALVPLLGLEQVNRYFQAVFKPLLTEASSTQNNFAAKLRFLHMVIQRLINMQPYSDEARQLAGKLFGLDTYMFFQPVSQNPQRFAEAAYLLGKLNESNLPLFQFAEVKAILTPERNLFAEAVTQQFRQESELWNTLARDVQKPPESPSVPSGTE